VRWSAHLSSGVQGDHCESDGYRTHVHNHLQFRRHDAGRHRAVIEVSSYPPDTPRSPGFNPQRQAP
jgi:hypothetical protein